MRSSNWVQVVVFLFLWVPFNSYADEYQEKHLGELYDRLASILHAKKPIVVTIYVALCDNDSQGIVPVKNRRICKGDMPEQNLYWATSGGLKGHLQKQRWKRVLYEHSETDNVAVKGVWTRNLFSGGELRKRGIKGKIPVYIIGLGYRGSRIQDAMTDYFSAISNDVAQTMTLNDGTRLEYGGLSPLIGYIGHDYLMDISDKQSFITKAGGNSALHKGVFGLSCFSDVLFRPAIQRRNTHILVLNTSLTYPSAFTVLGIIRGVAEGKGHKGIHREAARAFANGQKRSVKTMLRALSYGD